MAPHGGGKGGHPFSLPLLLFLLLFFLAALVAGGVLLARRAEARKKARLSVAGS